MTLTRSPFKSRLEAAEYYAEVMFAAERDGCVLSTMNMLGRRDLFFLLTRMLNRKDIDRDWLFERCWEVQLEPNGYLDLWAREHYKSTIITFGKSIQDVLDSHSPDSYYWDEEVTIGIFSHTRPIAKGFLSQIMREFENNTLLKDCYPEVLYRNPKREARSWSLDNGIIVKRKTNPNAATIEAWGLVDGQPTSKHFKILVFDDTVTKESVTETQMPKTTDAWSLSLNLGAAGGKRRTIGTRYHLNDTYRTMMEREAVTPRVKPATVDGTAQGAPVFLSADILAEKRREMGPYIFAAQMLQNPKAEDAMGFQEQWLQYYDAHPYQHKQLAWPSKWLYYLLCDPANEKKKENDYTVMLVIAMSQDQSYYLVDGLRDRLNLRERTKKLFQLRYKYDIKHAVGYEKYGKDSDIEHIQEVMERDARHFSIMPLAGPMAKNDRIRRLVPPFADNRVWLPQELQFIDYEGSTQDLVKLLVTDEYNPFPVGAHDDILDCFSRIRDPQFGATFPAPSESPSAQQEVARAQAEYAKHQLEYR